MWIARDRKGDLRLYLSKRPPIRFENHFLDDGDEYSGYGSVYLLKSEYPEITWENSPKEVEISVKI